MQKNRTSSPSRLARFLKGKRALILAGDLCPQVSLDGRTLLDYAAELATRLGCPVGATGNTITYLKNSGVNAKKLWAMEVVDFLRSPWREPLMPQSPQVLILMGYSAGVAQTLAAAIPVPTISLESSPNPQATYSLPPAASFAQWRQNLEALLHALE